MFLRASLQVLGWPRLPFFLTPTATGYELRLPLKKFLYLVFARMGGESYYAGMTSFERQLTTHFLFSFPFYPSQQFYGVCGGGRLYFGFTEYNNDGNRKNDGNCCDGEEDDSGQCPVACDLIFQLSISGLDA